MKNFKCEECGDVFSKDHSHTNGNGDMICPNCNNEELSESNERESNFYTQVKFEKLCNSLHNTSAFLINGEASASFSIGSPDEGDEDALYSDTSILSVSLCNKEIDLDEDILRTAKIISDTNFIVDYYNTVLDIKMLSEK